MSFLLKLCQKQFWYKIFIRQIQYWSEIWGSIFIHYCDVLFLEIFIERNGGLLVSIKQKRMMDVADVWVCSLEHLQTKCHPFGFLAKLWSAHEVLFFDAGIEGKGKGHEASSKKILFPELIIFDNLWRIGIRFSQLEVFIEWSRIDKCRIMVVFLKLIKCVVNEIKGRKSNDFVFIGYKNCNVIFDAGLLPLQKIAKVTRVLISVKGC